MILRVRAHNLSPHLTPSAPAPPTVARLNKICKEREHRGKHDATTTAVRCHIKAERPKQGHCPGREQVRAAAQPKKHAHKSGARRSPPAFSHSLTEQGQGNRT